MKNLLRLVLIIAVTLGFSRRADAQGGSPVTDMMIKGRNALNDLKYREADSLARRVLALGNLLSRQQHVDALQLIVAATFPEEPGEQHVDSAIALIKQLVGLGAAKGIPREMSWPGLDSLYAFVALAAQPAKVVLGARVAGAIIYVDGQPQGPIQGLRTVLVSPGKSVALSIRAENCTPWDSTVTTLAGDSIRIGFRNPRCSK